MKLSIFPFRKQLILFMLGIAFLTQSVAAHVTFQTDRPIYPRGYARIDVVVPNESNTDTTEVTVTVPDAFIAAGGRLSRVEFPSGWQVKLDKEDAGSANSSHDSDSHDTGSASAKPVIKQVTFAGGSIPPDGYDVFHIQFQVPNQPGQFRFPSVQTYAGGKVVSWSELVPGAAHPAPTLTILKEPSSLWTIANLALILSVLAILISAFQAFRRRSLRASSGHSDARGT